MQVLCPMDWENLGAIHRAEKRQSLEILVTDDCLPLANLTAAPGPRAVWDCLAGSRMSFHLPEYLLVRQRLFATCSFTGLFLGTWATQVNYDIFVELIRETGKIAVITVQGSVQGRWAQLVGALVETCLGIPGGCRQSKAWRWSVSRESVKGPLQGPCARTEQAWVGKRSKGTKLEGFVGCRSRGPSSGVTSSRFPEDAGGQGTGANWDRESHKFAFCRDPSGVGQLSGEGRDEGRVGRSGGTDSDLLSAVCQGRACCQALGTPRLSIPSHTAAGGFI